MLRWLWENLGSLLLAFVLSFTVWVVAVNAEDPVAERTFAFPVPIHYTGLTNGLTVVGEPDQEARVVLRAPDSVWRELTAEDLHAEVDLSDLAEGSFELPVEVQVSRRPVQVTSVDPSTLRLTLEPADSVTLSIQVVQLGETAVGTRLASMQPSTETAVVTGPRSSVARIVGLRAEVNVTGLSQSSEKDSTLQAYDREGRTVSDIEIAPAKVQVQVAVEQLGGYRSVAVIPLLVGQVKSGYRVTNITVSPTLVTVVSSDPDVIGALPGFVNTEAIRLTGASGNLEQQTPLNLPQGVSLVGEATVLVQISIAPIESSITITRRLEIQGLRLGLYAQGSPEEVSVILTGPLPTLEQLQPQQVRVVLDLTGLPAGTYPITPTVIELPEDVVIETVLPDVIEVTIRTTPFPTSTPAS